MKKPEFVAKAIVTTTINPPTPALLKFVEIAKRDGWVMVIVGDQKTPHGEYEVLALDESVFYLSPEMQEEKYPKLSELIGWNCIQRRNFGLIFANEIGAEVIATVDDDNIPDDDWGKDCMVNRKVEVELYQTDDPVFDPLSRFGLQCWHRGYPLELLKSRIPSLKEPKTATVGCLVQADLWNGDPDVDAICRIAQHPDLTFGEHKPFASDKPAPFNSQNTFLSRHVLPIYFLFPHIGRLDDIWAAYVTQMHYPDSVVFGRASVTQVRNEHNLFKDLKAEMIGYEHSYEVATDPSCIRDLLPERSYQAWEEYKNCF